MQTSTVADTTTNHRVETLARVTLIVLGALYTLTGLVMLFTPFWFYQHIGTFPPFNRHYTGDLGTVQLPLGLGMLVAARAPARNMLLAWVVAASALAHVANHIYDSVMEQATLAHWLTDTAPLALVAVALLAVAWGLRAKG